MPGTDKALNKYQFLPTVYLGNSNSCIHNKKQNKKNTFYVPDTILGTLGVYNLTKKANFFFMYCSNFSLSTHTRLK